jgi:hypothetical protein
LSQIVIVTAHLAAGNTWKGGQFSYKKRAKISFSVLNLGFRRPEAEDILRISSATTAK